MTKAFFQSIETNAHNHSLPLADVLSRLAFNDQGLIPVIAQDATSKEVLMQAWMNREALDRTLKSGRMVYWSRSRQCYWVKGESSGHTQELVRMSLDCDGDVILCQINQIGAACHTGRPACFYLDVVPEKDQVVIQGDASLP
ncbi:phosphoribosyl-AMP cyclohydrolase [Motiliproteus coralliicola]|uniref:Phosphoribosyl-AMP cyclohydrolase n=1 Tax=Motiliproteus coralliicola TaxID=2283196 RepID=A0A369WNX5_9GAMM|nr:phosphoribosyl-AMP cyclohydrolase [Motiliproteus coralliicola]RDE22923.1 phosphoribosyl-AMP cyclohydrolase [Motiliproteus coralliicola]